MQEVTINGVEYVFYDQNITGDEVAFSAFSGYMAFNGSLPEAVLKQMADNYDKAVDAKIATGQITKEIGDKMKKEYGSAVMRLVGQRLNLIFEVSDGIFTAAFDKKMNPDKSLDEILAPRVLEWGASRIGGIIGGVVGSVFGPVGTVVGTVAGSVLGSVVGGLHSDDFYKTLKTVVVDTYNMVLEYDKDGTHYKFTNDELSLTCPDGSTNPFAFVDNKATIPSEFGCKKGVFINELTQDKITVNYEQMQISLDTKDDESIKNGLDMTLKIGGENLEQITINSHTYNIKELSNLELRNAIENIPQVSFLLSHILIKVGEYLDLGEKGIYKIKSGDTLSTIAQLNGMVTKDLVRLNSWLCDEGRISFNQNKVLIEGNPLNLSNTNHTLYGEANAENVLIDANGGDNIEFINLSLVA